MDPMESRGPGSEAGGQQGSRSCVYRTNGTGVIEGSGGGGVTGQGIQAAFRSWERQGADVLQGTPEGTIPATTFPLAH